MAINKEIHWPQIFAEGAAIVVSILLAFGIDASWDQWQEHREEQRILGSLLDELKSNQAHLAERVQWQKDVMLATRQLLNEAATSNSTLSSDSIDYLVGSASWFNNASTFEMSAVDAVILGGNLSIVENETLRQRITGWSREVVRVTQTERQDYDIFSDVWMPFLRGNAYLSQIHNSIDVQPGTGNEDYVEDVRLGPHVTSHSNLLRDREFQNVLLHRLWVHGDILYEYEQLKPRLSSLIELLTAELEQ
jgi:hypothetical protein